MLKKLHNKNKYPPHLKELKFNLPKNRLVKFGYTKEQLDNEYQIHMHDIRLQVLDILIRYADGVFSAVVDKKKAYSTWTPEELGNFIFAETLYKYVFKKFESRSIDRIIYDKGRLSAIQNKEFQSYLSDKDNYYRYRGQNKLSKYPDLYEETSDHHPGIWAADYVAGMFYLKHYKNTSMYTDMIKSVHSGEKFYW